MSTIVVVIAVLMIRRLLRSLVRDGDVHTAKKLSEARKLNHRKAMLRITGVKE